VTPMALLEQYGSDGVRYWAASGRPGTDTAFDEGQMKVGRRLAIKLLNASKFALGVATKAGAGQVTQPIDRSMLRGLADLVADVTRDFDEYDYARALERTERFFWSFCDDYLELVKGRAYGSVEQPEVASARESLALGLAAVQQLFAPHLPFVAEEVWSWWKDGSIHRSAWPAADELAAHAADGDPIVLEVASAVLGAVRKTKSDEKRSLKTFVRTLVVRDIPERLDALKLAATDVQEAGNIGSLELVESNDFSVEVELAEPDAA
jgi:valyl-tRNA synthetase